MAFELVNLSEQIKPKKPPQISVSKRGRLIFNKIFIEQFRLDAEEKQFMTFRLDADKQLLQVEFKKRADREQHPVQVKISGRNLITVRIVPILEQLGIDVNEAVNLPWYWESDFLYVDFGGLK